jgi:ElaB/YqjD/DUF883 family membrane-anchored ribosome-binding protein
MSANVSDAKQQLLEDFGKVVSDAEALVKAVRNAPGEKVGELRQSVEASLGSAKERLRQLQDAAVERTTVAARATDEFVHENAWPLLGAAAAVGFIFGLVLRSMDRD